MGPKWTARLSTLLTLAMVAASMSVWSSSRASEGSPSVTVGVDLVAATIDSASYELLVSNRGDRISEAVAVTYRVPRAARFVGASRSQASDSQCASGSTSERTCTWNLGHLAPGEVRSIQVDIAATPSQAERPVISGATVVGSGRDISTHVNRTLYIHRGPAPDSFCDGAASRTEVVGELENTLLDGQEIEKLWDLSLDCSDPSSPRMVAAAQAAGPPTCVDVDPETTTAPGNNEVMLTALVTDGTASGRTATGEDSCSGNPVPNVEVFWTIEEDDPDAYFSKNEVFATSGQPNTISSITDSGDNAGRTEVFVKLASPTTGENRASGRIGNDVREAPADEIEEVECLLAPGCPGQAANEDDVALTWTAPVTESPSPTATQSPTASPTGSPTAEPTGSPMPGPSQPASPTPSASPTTTRSASPSPTGAGLARTVTLFASKPRVVHGAAVTFSGRVFSSNPSCEDAGENVRIRRRVHGTNAFQEVSSQETDGQGNFQFTTKGDRSADYVAVAPAHDDCAEAASASVTVLVRVKVSARAADPTVRRGGTLVLVGKVTPKHGGAVLIQRKEGKKKWVRVRLARLNKKSRFRASIPVDWRGPRTYRAKFQKQDEDHQPNKSKPVTVRAGG